MVSFEDGCVGCGKPCIHEACKYWRVAVLTCDRCGREADELYLDDGGCELCASCALDGMEKVSVESVDARGFKSRL